MGYITVYYKLHESCLLTCKTHLRRHDRHIQKFDQCIYKVFGFFNLPNTWLIRVTQWTGDFTVYIKFWEIWLSSPSDQHDHYQWIVFLYNLYCSVWATPPKKKLQLKCKLGLHVPYKLWYQHAFFLTWYIILPPSLKSCFRGEMKHGKMTTNSGRPRRKCVSVSFVGDDDVIGHIVDVNKKYGMHAFSDIM